MQTVINWFAHRPLRLVGGFLVFLSVGLLIFLILLDFVVGLRNPYLGIVTYLILPAVLVLGLLLVPLDSWIQRKRVAHGLPEYPVIDLCDLRQRKIFSFFALASVVILIVMTVVTYKSVEYMDHKAFCGEVCHKVMVPEYTAYLRSAHASVECVACHIGPGAPWFVKAKISGVPQVWHYTLGDYPRPLETPVRALRPSRDTCENCHWPQAFYGSTLRTTVTYDTDRANTRQVSSMIMHVGSGGVVGSGIHSHMISKIHYLPAVENHTEIAWVRVERPDGSSQEFVNPAHRHNLAKLRKKFQNRFMDCIDCHNRAAHDFEPVEKLIDDAIAHGKIDQSLPFIKREAMAAVGDTDKPPTQTQYSRAITRIRGIEAFFKRELGEGYPGREGDVRRAVRAIEQAYSGSMFPHMRVAPSTYPNWRSHDGCFRCHGAMERLGKGRDADISADCGLCHTEQTSGEPAELVSGP